MEIFNRAILAFSRFLTEKTPKIPVENKQI
jgi:hypothetical protein